MEVLSVHIVSAGYQENSKQIEDIQFTIKQGELVGLIGPNGAGKSTTIKAILGLLKETAGTIAFTGESQNYAYIPERPVFYDGLTLWEHLELAASAHELNRDEFLNRGGRLLQRFRLQEVRDQFPAHFSKGMQQKVMLILGFLLTPDLYIVDEPFIGLDPRATKDFLVLLEEERQRGAAVLMSTHVLDTAEKICDSFLLLAGGRLIAQGSLDEIRLQSGIPDGSLFDCFNQLLERAEC